MHYIKYDRGGLSCGVGGFEKENFENRNRQINMGVDLMRIFSREVRSRRREKREEGEKEKEKKTNL